MSESKGREVAHSHDASHAYLAAPTGNEKIKTRTRDGNGRAETRSGRIGDWLKDVVEIGVPANSYWMRLRFHSLAGHEPTTMLILFARDIARDDLTRQYGLGSSKSNPL